MNLHINMKCALIASLLIIFTVSANAQYYYKDIVVPRNAAAQIASYKQNRIKSVRLSSFESDGQPTEEFEGRQKVDQAFQRITTTLRSAISGSSELTSYFNGKGQLIRTSDTTDGAGSTTQLLYNESGQLSRVVNVSISAGGRQDKEEHVWTINDGKPVRMLRIKNSYDTTLVEFVRDEEGNIAEENSSRAGRKLPSFFYYYTQANQLSDIGSYNDKAKRILPAYVFDYNQTGQLRSMMVVPEGSSDYQKWYYEYRDGLKAKETVFNKRKQLLGRIEYSYE